MFNPVQPIHNNTASGKEGWAGGGGTKTKRFVKRSEHKKLDRR